MLRVVTKFIATSLFMVSKNTGSNNPTSSEANPAETLLRCFVS